MVLFTAVSVIHSNVCQTRGVEQDVVRARIYCLIIPSLLRRLIPDSRRIK